MARIKKRPKQDTAYKKAPAASHVRRFRRIGAAVDVQFKGRGTVYHYKIGTAPQAAGVLANLVRAVHPGKVVWDRLRRPEVPFDKR